MGIVHDDNIEFQIDDQLLSEVMLMNIWNVAISYATLKKKKTNEQNQEESRIKDTESLEKNYTRENEGGLKIKAKGIAGVKKK